MRRGFTIVELLITITIMGILLVLGVVGISSTQVRARDDKRTADVQSIALHLESFYKTGSTGSTVLSRYPTTDLATSAATMTSYLPDIDTKSLTAPGASGPTSSFIAATNAIQTVAGVAPQPTISQYVYQPILNTSLLCTGTTGTEDCRKFNIYYRLESDNTVYMITSKNQ